MLAREDLRQLAQRITARFHLTPLDAAETGEYLRHRYRDRGRPAFPVRRRGGASASMRHAGGVPRLVNVIAERSLLAGYAHDEPDRCALGRSRRAEVLAPPRRAT